MVCSIKQAQVPVPWPETDCAPLGNGVNVV